MITFKSINIDGSKREWNFNDTKELEKEWRSDFPDLPANDDLVKDVIIDNKEVWVGRTKDKDEEDLLPWFEDILTYLGIDIWN